jgi:hypothetical protein
VGVRITGEASQPFEEAPPGDGWQASMDFPHDIADLPGDHFTMLEDFAETTAEAVSTWLTAADQ